MTSADPWAFLDALAGGVEGVQVAQDTANIDVIYPATHDRPTIIAPSKQTPRRRGRPRKARGEKRVVCSYCLAPQTIKAIKMLAWRERTSQGAILDRLVAAARQEE